MDTAPVVIGTDFSSHSRAALSAGLRIAERRGVKAHVVHVLDTIVVTEVESRLSEYKQQVRQELIRDARVAWEAFSKGIPGSASLQFEAVVNNRIVGLIERVQGHGAQLLVIGATGKLGIGTMASGCIRRAAVDVLAVREETTNPFRRILVGVDLSEGSRCALERAVQLAREESAALDVLYVVQSTSSLFPFAISLGTTSDATQGELLRASRAQLEAFVQPFQAQLAGVEMTLRVEVSAGHGSGILDVANDQGHDLIVVGRRGRSNLREVLLGSTAEQVLARSTASVCIVACR